MYTHKTPPKIQTVQFLLDYLLATIFPMMAKWLCGAVFLLACNLIQSVYLSTFT
jgi:hypothetical protein